MTGARGVARNVHVGVSMSRPLKAEHARAKTIAVNGILLRDAVVTGYLATGRALDVPAIAARLKWSETKIRRVLDLHRGAPDGVSCVQDSVNDSGRLSWVYTPTLWYMRELVNGLREKYDEAREELALASVKRERGREVLGIVGVVERHPFARAPGVRPSAGGPTMITVRGKNKYAVEVALFVGTLAGQTLHEALANLERDAKSYGWDRAAVREAASAIRLRAAKNGGVL